MDTRKFAMNYGAVLGLFLVAIAVIMWSVGADDKQSVIPALLNNGITIAFIAYAIIQYREINNNGFITYAESLKLGTTVAFFSSIILAFYQFIYISYLDPNALSDIMKITEQSMLESNPEISDEDLDMALEMTSKFMQPHWMMIMGMLGGTFMGFLYSLIISIFVKKSDHTLTSILIDENTKTTPIFKGLLFENYLKTFKNYSDFNGRSSVREFWMFLLFNIIIMLTLFVVDFLLVYLGGTPIISSIFSLLTFIPTLAVGVRRMHDIGKPGWYILIPLYNLILSTIIGDKGKNNYGPDPDIE
jgi:uncharacterized membrane protein YhaH (DUF805 family)